MNKKGKILIVDDIARNLQIIGNILNPEGYQIYATLSGKQALNVLKQKDIDLVLLDISMPEMDGYETITHIKQDKDIANVPVIFVTARSQSEDIIKGFQHGAVDFITKPFNATELLQRVATHVKIKHQQKVIEQKNKELEEVNATKDKFFSLIAHDLKNPFTTILGFTNLLISNLDTYDETKIKHFLSLIENSTKNTHKLLENLLQWSRSQTGNIKFEPQTISLKHILQEVVMIVEPQANKKEISIKSEAPEELQFEGDLNMINTIVRNLLSNALKFTNRNGSIYLKANKENESVVISIEDTGVGMSQQKCETLFEIHKKTSTLGTENEKGTGLGLILCKEFVEKHKGTIKVESTLNIGSKFTVTLPEHQKLA